MASMSEPAFPGTPGNFVNPGTLHNLALAAVAIRHGRIFRRRWNVRRALALPPAPRRNYQEL